MRYLPIIVLLLSVSLTCGCSIISSTKLLTPEHFGLTPIEQNVYIETGADEKAKGELRDAMVRAENAIRSAYGSVNSHPIVHACISESCYESLGGKTSRAKVYGDHILLSPRGFNWHFLAHEWSHAEIRSRLSFSARWHLPQWFDEGLAVSVSEAPEHSEAHWQFLVAPGTPRPSREELLTYKSLRQWLNAVERYGEKQNIERKAKGEPEVRPVYSAAGHEVRPWLSKAGSHGLIDLISRLNNGEDFEAVYNAANNAFNTDLRVAARPSAG